jgi:hypothetical protein
MSFGRSLLVIGCTLALAAPALAAGGSARPARPKPKKKMKVTTVVDKTVDGVVVERKLFLRSGGSKRKGRKVTLEAKVRALGKEKLVSDRKASKPASLTDGGRLVEQAGSYRERRDGARRSAVITLVRPGARHFSGPEAKVVYSGKRVRTVQKTRKVGGGSAAAARRARHSEEGLEVLNYDALNERYIQVAARASLSAEPESDTVHFQGELHGLLVNWDVSRQAIQGAIEHGRLEDGTFAVQASGGWVTIQMLQVPTAIVALRQEDVERFLTGSD